LAAFNVTTVMLEATPVTDATPAPTDWTGVATTT